MSTKEMRSLTEKKVKKLPEVREKLLKRKFEDEKKTNRLLSQVFSRVSNVSRNTFSLLFIFVSLKVRELTFLVSEITATRAQR